MEKLLEVKNLSVQYVTGKEVVEAVNHISFSLNKGETIGLVGETGAGKTTTALSLLRLLPERTGRITEGEVIFHGEDILAHKEKEMRDIRGEKIAMIFQDPMTSLNPVITVGNQIKESLITHNHDGLKSEELDQRVEKVLEMVGIPASRKNDYPHQFSGGMKQRVVIAMALVCEPDLLIADEPTTALDVTIQAQVLLMMKNLRDRLGTAMIMITHDLGIVAQTCDKVAVMYAGEIIEQGTLEDIFTGDKHHPYTVGLFGAIPNISDESERLKPIAGLMPDPTDLPIGCSFFPRCPHCMERCKAEKAAIYVNGTHSICCHLFDQEVKE